MIISQMFRLHIREITNFLNTIVIKFEPFVDIMNNNPDYIDSIVEDDPTTYPYYRILIGDIAFASTDIYVYNPDTEADVPLSRDVLIQNPNITTFYRSDDNFNVLLSRYPNDQFLIRRVFDPIIDINQAINAPNLTLLSTNNTDRFLNEYERGDLIVFLREFLIRFDYRWYINVFEYEDLYSYAYWSMLWYLLPIVLLTKRMLNIKTDKVHPFHIWEYLTSVGFGSYRGYLSREQEMFLYRNNDYLKYNVGKKFLLSILSDVFLKPMKYSLHEKVIVAHTENRLETADKYPDVLSVHSNVIDYNSKTDFSRFLTDIYENNYDYRNDSEYQLAITEKFIKSPANTLHTKFIELVRNSSTSELMLMLRFILDAVVYRVSKNRLHYDITIQSPVSNITTELTVLDSLNLLYYCFYRVVNETPVNLFNRYKMSTALASDDQPAIPEYLYIGDYSFKLSSYIDTDGILNTTPYTSDDIYDAQSLSMQIGEQYLWLFSLINSLQLTYDYPVHEMLYSVYNTLVPDDHTITITQTLTTYNEYFTSNPGANEIISSITTTEQYLELIFNIFEGICPLTYGFSTLARDDKNTSVIIHKIKTIFMYLASYNVTFVAPTIDRQDYYELPRICANIYHDESVSSIVTHEFGRLNYDYEISLTKQLSTSIDIELQPMLSLTDRISTSVIDIQNEDVSNQLMNNISINRAIYINGCGIDVEFIDQP